MRAHVALEYLISIPAEAPAPVETSGHSFPTWRRKACLNRSCFATRAATPFTEQEIAVITETPLCPWAGLPARGTASTRPGNGSSTSFNWDAESTCHTADMMRSATEPAVMRFAFGAHVASTEETTFTHWMTAIRARTMTDYET